MMLEVDGDDIPLINKPMICVKKIVCLFQCGEWVHPTQPVNWELPKGDINRLVEFSQDHINYHCAMIAGELKHLVNIGA